MSNQCTRLLDWFDQRTGWRTVANALRNELVPGGAGWRQVLGRTLVFCFLAQAVTGFFLWAVYLPGAQTAWESVYFIQHRLPGGWLLRGLHHFTAQIMVVAAFLKVAQLVVDRVYRPPHELGFWTLLSLALVFVGFLLTGFLLPWDQNAYWSSRTVTDFLASVPVAGPLIQRLIVGDAGYGHFTLARSFAVHAGVLPVLVIALAGLYHRTRRRNEAMSGAGNSGTRGERYWPGQAWRDAVVCLAIMGTAVWFSWRWNGDSASLTGAPADPGEPFPAARPEWFFSFAYQFLQYPPGSLERWGFAIFPVFFVLLLVLMPKLGETPRGHRLNLGLLVGFGLVFAILTARAFRTDGRDIGLQEARAAIRRTARRAVELAGGPDGIPTTGALAMLGGDPYTQGPKLFVKYCATCHRYGGNDGAGGLPTGPPTAPDLKGFASREWLTELLDPTRIDDENHFGATHFREGKMVRWVKKNVPGYSASQREQLARVIATVSAEANLRSQKGLVTDGGAELIRTGIGCAECHSFHAENPDATGPSLTGYGSRPWLIRFISDPRHAQFYGDRNDRMPAFGDAQVLDDASIGLLADWLRGDWYTPETAPVRR